MMLHEIDRSRKYAAEVDRYVRSDSTHPRLDDKDVKVRVSSTAPLSDSIALPVTRCDGHGVVFDPHGNQIV